MLGSLARLLRVVGIDAEYVDSGQADDGVLARAATGDRVLITRDYDLARRAKAHGIESVLVKNLPVDQQLAIVLTHLGLGLDPDRFFTRCTLCNGSLEPISAQDASPHVPPAVLQRAPPFTRCTRCGKVYWPGTHVESMEARLQEIVRSVAGGSDPVI